MNNVKPSRKVVYLVLSLLVDVFFFAYCKTCVAHRQLGDAYKLCGKTELATKHFINADSLASLAIQKVKQQP